MKKHLITLSVLAVAFSSNAFAHGGQIEVGSGARGPVQITTEQQTALGLKTVAAESRPLSSLLNINGEVQLPSDHQADVSLSISGKIKELYANVGDTVKAGQRLALVESRAGGNVNVTINAPMSGIIDARDVAVGQAVEPIRIFHISESSQVVVIGKVYEESLAQVKVGQEAHVRLLAYPDQVFSGKVTLVEPALDPLSRTVKVWIQLDNPQGLMKPNMFARIAIVLKKNDEALAIPNNAIIEANGEKFVFVRDGNSFKRVEITLGTTDDLYSEVTDGLVPGDEVATQGSRQIYTMWLTGGQMKSGDGD